MRCVMCVKCSVSGARREAEKGEGMVLVEQFVGAAGWAI